MYHVYKTLTPWMVTEDKFPTLTLITWSLTLREEHRLRVFQNRVLRKIFGPKWKEITGEWRRLRNEKLYDPHSAPNIIRMIKSSRMSWMWHVARVRKRRYIKDFGGET